MRIVEAADYIMGRKFLGDKKDRYRGSLETIEKAKSILARHATAKKNVQLVDSYSIFYKLEPDIAQEVPTAEREEIFYAMKMDQLSPVIPAKGLFLLTKCYNLYGTMNLFPRVVPTKDLEEMFSEGYCAEGYNLRDVICSMFDEKYRPLSEGEVIVPNGKNWDIYIESEDMVAIIPDNLKQKLSQDDVKRMKVVKKDIVLGDKPIRFLGDYIGAVNSTYDLTSIV